eukprot:c9864_g1_i1.p2 GENE.c9864_g1_i1~~c9864_g1_i1.p2  ORF type:complete len:173 (+),score=20.23 c9864_g1_i1:163-681(+)
MAMLCSFSFKSLLINIYLIIFSLFVLLAEAKVQRFLSRFRFLDTAFGRMMMMLFIGCLCFVFKNAPNIVFGLFIFVDVFLIHTYVICKVRPAFLKEEREAHKEDLKAMKNDAKATVSAGVKQGAREAVSETMQESAPSWARGVDNTNSNKRASEPHEPASDVPSWAHGVGEQ